MYCKFSYSYIDPLGSQNFCICVLLCRYTRCRTSVSDFRSNNPQITSELPTQDYRYHKLSFEKHLEGSSGHTLSFYQNLVKFRFKNMFLKESLTWYFTVI